MDNEKGKSDQFVKLGKEEDGEEKKVLSLATRDVIEIDIQGI